MSSILLATTGGAIVGAAVFLLIFVFVAYRYRLARVERNETRLRAADVGLGLARVDAQRWRGTVDGFEVDISVLPKTSKHHAERTRVSVGGALPPNVSLGKAGLVAGLTGRGLDAVSGSDVRVGDPSFDDAVAVKGRRDEVFALLDEALREVVTDATAEGWVLIEGRWQYTVSGPPSPQDFVRARRGLQLAAAVHARAHDVLPRLVARALNDPCDGVRRGALECLLETYRDAPASARAFEQAQRSDLPEHRLAVSIALADHADLGAFVRDDDLPADLRAAALEALVSDAPTPELLAWCAQALARPSPLALRRVAVQCLGQHPGFEPVLIACLADPDEALVGDAVAGLAATGTAAAVAPLRDLAAWRLRSEANEAVAQIQARIGATAGALAVVEADGALALAEPDVGGA